MKITKNGTPLDGLNESNISFVEEQVMYWRKANHIHKWFVDNVQDGEDDCEKYRVSTDQMRNLLSACEHVIEHSKLVPSTAVVTHERFQGAKAWIGRVDPGKVIEDPTVAKELLIRCEGFFFGTYEYDEEYLQDVIDTRDWLTKMLRDEENGLSGDLYYQSSW